MADSAGSPRFRLLESVEYFAYTLVGLVKLHRQETELRVLPTSQEISPQHTVVGLRPALRSRRTLSLDNP